tara:strand:+ start:17 stop:232 length:216 start_codon:yes stop_codon:yes gene_type:complete
VRIKLFSVTDNLKKTDLICIIGAKEGIEFVEKYFPENTNLWIADIDENLNDQGYIVPGLGDVGDLAYGPKI